jgi:uncharacterized protein (DUF885 family)
LFKDHLELEIDEHKYDLRLKDPSIFLPHNSIQEFLISDFKNKKAIILSRIDTQIKNLNIGIKILKNSNKIIKIWLDNSIYMSSNVDFFDELKNKIKFSKNELIKVDKLKKTVEKYLKFLKTLYNQSIDNYGIGKSRFSKILKKSKYINQNINELLKLGQNELKKYKSEMKKIANKNNCTIEQFFKKIDKKIIKKDKLIEITKKITLDSKKFIIKNKLFEINHKEKLIVMKTPKQLEKQFPAAAYVPPRMDDKKQIGRYFITTPRTKEELAHMNLHELKLTSVHEAFPGHHLQMSTIHNTKFKNNILRQFLASITFVEGWGLYCEKLMVDTGFSKTDYDKFLMYKMRALRACRIIIDINTNCNNWTYKKAWKFLKKHTMIPESRAKGECFWYSQRPTYPMSYLIGAHIIEKARDENVLKNKMDYITFHKKILSYGNLPAQIIANYL